MVDVEVVDTSNNYYDADRQNLVLDRKLKRFPEAFQYMKRHELRHHKVYSSSSSRVDVFLRTFWHEFSTDLDYAFVIVKMSRSLEDTFRMKEESSNRMSVSWCSV